MIMIKMARRCLTAFFIANHSLPCRGAVNPVLAKPRIARVIVHARESWKSTVTKLSSLRQRERSSTVTNKGVFDTAVSQLGARSWSYLTNDKLWGAPATTVTGPNGVISAWKHWLPKDEYGSANSVVKTRGVVRATPQEIFDMIFDSSRTKEYNKYSVGRTDVQKLGGKNSKIVWNRTNPPGTKRPHDFCTLMHGQVYANNGTHLLMTTATEHPHAKPSKAYLRSEILLGVNLMKPVGPRLTELTTINHVKTSGVPAFLAEKFAVSSAIDFVKTVDAVLGGDVPESEEAVRDDDEAANTGNRFRIRFTSIAVNGNWE
mmetsp:Transcript_56591/g.111812  ORF Transcript_56591/g.111812 Transcript_56591/m.111812 type:complete len:317 (-) Transcript_56591:92-1042(-)